MKLLFIILFFCVPLVNGFGQTKLVDSIITKELLKEYVMALAHDSMEGRFSGSIGNIKAGLYLQKKFEEIGLSKVIEFDAYTNEVIRNGASFGNNIIGAIPGNDSLAKDSIIIFSAHYDHIGEHLIEGQLAAKRIYKNDHIYNGANDNASGLSAILALAKYYNTLKNNKYTLLFVAFTGEEMGMVGSSEFVKSINKKLVRMTINLEMLGRNPNKQIHPYFTGRQNNTIIKKFNKNLVKLDTSYAKKFFIADPYLEQNLFARSDNFSFDAIGIKNVYCIMLSNPTDYYYHTNADEANTLDYETMQIVVKAIALAIIPFL